MCVGAVHATAPVVNRREVGSGTVKRSEQTTGVHTTGGEGITRDERAMEMP